MNRNIQKKTVLIVDDESDSIELLAERLHKDYEILIANNGEKALELARRDSYAPHLILLDINMPKMNGYEVCKRLKADDKTKGIPIIFVTILDEPEKEKKGFLLGAADYITKPFNIEIVKARVRTHLELKFYRDDLELQVAKRTEEVESLRREINESQKEIISTLGNVVETKSKETANHVERVSQYVYLLARLAGLDSEEATILKEAAPMHDVGKIGIPESILNKPGPLDPEERRIIKTHARVGYDILSKSQRRIFKAAAIVAHQHHERYDGKGYPGGLKGKEINIYGRIAAIVDVFDALATRRCYKPPWTSEEILEEFRTQKGKQFDPDLIDLFLNNAEKFQDILKKYPEEN
jgi:putative two-component system response regulator